MLRRGYAVAGDYHPAPARCAAQSLSLPAAAAWCSLPVIRPQAGGRCYTEFHDSPRIAIAAEPLIQCLYRCVEPVFWPRRPDDGLSKMATHLRWDGAHDAAPAWGRRRAADVSPLFLHPPRSPTLCRVLGNRGL